jgi:hypothetical protein
MRVPPGDGSLREQQQVFAAALAGAPRVERIIGFPAAFRQSMFQLRIPQEVDHLPVRIGAFDTFHFRKMFALRRFENHQ